MKHESFDQVFQLGMVAVKVIVLFLLVMVSVLLGIIWYQSELEISFLTNNSGEETLLVESEEESEFQDMDSTSETEAEGEVSATVLEVNQVGSTLVVQVLGSPTTTVVSYTPETAFVSQVSEGTDTDASVTTEIITAADVRPEDSVLLTITSESLSDEENWIAEQVVLVASETTEE